MIAGAFVALRAVLVAWVMAGDAASQHHLYHALVGWRQEFNALWWVAGGCVVVAMC